MTPILISRIAGLTYVLAGIVLFFLPLVPAMRRFDDGSAEAFEVAETMLSEVCVHVANKQVLYGLD